MSSRPGAENPVARDYQIPSEVSTGAPPPLRPMPEPRVVNPEGNILGTQAADEHSTADSVEGARGQRQFPSGGELVGGHPERARNSTGPQSHMTTGVGVGVGATAPVGPWDGAGGTHPAIRGDR